MHVSKETETALSAPIAAPGAFPALSSRMLNGAGVAIRGLTEPEEVVKAVHAAFAEWYVPSSPGWPDPLESPQADAIRSGKFDDTEFRDLFDRMERELKLLREANGARLAPGAGAVTEAMDECLKTLESVQAATLDEDSEGITDFYEIAANGIKKIKAIRDAALRPEEAAGQGEADWTDEQAFELARRMCVAHGGDPDAPVYRGHGEVGENWQVYLPMAAEALIFLKAASAIPRPAPVAPDIVPGADKP